MAGTGVFFFVVGPSGSGKDTLIEGARRALGDEGAYLFARRTITRPAGSAGEDHEAADEAAFLKQQAAGGFLIAWSAHGLCYGLDRSLLDAVNEGIHVVANGSRAVVPDLKQRVPRLVVLEVWAPEEVLAARIAGRGRESGAAIESRVARQVAPLDADVAVIRVANDAAPETGCERFVAALRQAAASFRLRRMPVDTGRRHTAFLPRDSAVVRAPDFLGGGRVEVTGEGRIVRAEIALTDPAALLERDEIGLSTSAFEAFGGRDAMLVAMRRTPSPASRDALRRKVQGHELGEDDYATVVRDIVDGCYPDSEVAGFLVAANRFLSDAEVLALARVRARAVTPIAWDAPIVADKHSMGGTAGSRITMIVVPIVAAHGGLVMPKTSSRAITSAAGTADAMEALARVDLTPEEVRTVVTRAGGCIAWNGRLTHSVLDDVMNAITRPLGLDSARWSVASILSKKVAAGATHVLIDVPWGPGSRTRTEAEATGLARLFETVGRGLGLTVEALVTDGRQPIGRGIGPALEARDVLEVLDNDRDAPADLAAKALDFAGRIIAWDPAVGSFADGRARAADLLQSGAARSAFDEIIDAQGRRPEPALPGRLTSTATARQAGRVEAIDGFVLGGIARRAGAPFDKGAGVDLHVRLGETVGAGAPLFTIHASLGSDLDAAKTLAAKDAGIGLDHMP